MGIKVSGLLDNVHRIYGFDRIRRALQRQKRDYTKNASGATENRWGGPHEHKREIARHRRQHG